MVVVSTFGFYIAWRSFGAGFPRRVFIRRLRLLQPIRQGFITTKSLRLFGVCTPEFDFHSLGIVEDLDIEEYITSHALKNCLLNILKRISIGEQQALDFYCKYATVGYIIAELRSSLIDGKKESWYEWIVRYSGETVFDCKVHSGTTDVCCRKLKIKLVLFEYMISWLKDANNLRYLHDGDTCNCVNTYSQTLDYHQEFITRLVKTGKISISRSDSNEPINETPFRPSENPTLPEDSSRRHIFNAHISGFLNRIYITHINQIID